MRIAEHTEGLQPTAPVAAGGLYSEWHDPFGRPRLSLGSRAAVFTPGRVSVVMPCYNAATFVSQAVESVIAQDHPDTELVLVDDASTDDSVAVVSAYGQRVVLVARDRRGGACVARNDGLERATGEHVLFLDADDYLLPGAITSLVSAAKNGVTPFGERLELTTRLRSVPSHRLRGWGTLEPLEYLLRKSIAPFEVLHPREPLYLAGGFDELVPQAQEKDLHIRLALSGSRFVSTGVIVGVARVHESPSRITNLAWADTDPTRHLDLSLHWLRLVSERTPPQEHEHYVRITCDRVVIAARRAADAGYPDLADAYLERLTNYFPDYQLPLSVRVFGGAKTRAGRRLLLRTTTVQRLLDGARRVASGAITGALGAIRPRDAAARGRSTAGEDS